MTIPNRFNRYASIFVLAILAISTWSIASAHKLKNDKTSKTVQESQSNTEWVSQSLKEMQTIKVGMTRADLLKVFTTEGGLSTRLWRTYVYHRCPYFKVDVKFRAVGPPAKDSEGQVTLLESAEDIITKISKPYLDWSIAD